MRPESPLERTNLEVHVDLCAMRYAQLDNRLSTLEEKVDEINNVIIDSNKSLSKVIITTAGTVVASILSVILVILMKF